MVKEELEDQRYGDVIVPDIVWNYSVGKYVSPEMVTIQFGNLGCLPRMTSLFIPDCRTFRFTELFTD